MRSPRGVRLAIACCVLAATACGGSESPGRAADSTGRIELPGLSILPPQKGDWFVQPYAHREGYPLTAVIRISKKLPGASTIGAWDGRLVFGGLMVLDLKDQKFATPTEFLESFKGERAGDSDESGAQGQRYVEFEAALDESLPSTCVRYRHLTEVGPVEGFSGSPAFNSTHGLYCLHPNWPRYAIDVTYSQLYARSQTPLSLEGEMEPFFTSLVFTSAHPVAVTSLARRRFTAPPG